MKTDIEIAQSVQGLAIEEITKKIGIPSSALEMYGKTKAKVNLSELGDFEQKPKGKLVLVTALTPTKAGEGKSTTTVGLVAKITSSNSDSALLINE